LRLGLGDGGLLFGQLRIGRFSLALAASIWALAWAAWAE
jgi:hypothetical protein